MRTLIIWQIFDSFKAYAALLLRIQFRNLVLAILNPAGATHKMLHTDMPVWRLLHKKTLIYMHNLEKTTHTI